MEGPINEGLGLGGGKRLEWPSEFMKFMNIVVNTILSEAVESSFC